MIITYFASVRICMHSIHVLLQSLVNIWGFSIRFWAALSRTMLHWIAFQSFKHCQVVRIDKLEPSQDNPGLCRTRLWWHLASCGQPSTTFLLLILFLLLALLLLFLQKVFAVTQLMSVQERQYVCNVLSPQPFCLFGPIFDLCYDFIFTVSHWTRVK